ncbi:MAG: hypothetical protein AAFS03_10710 [Pseudomonadota bacterium]
MSFDDETLRAYLAGTADEATVQAIEDAVAIDRDLEARLMAMDDLASVVAGAFETVPPAQRLETLEVAAPPKSFVLDPLPAANTTDPVADEPWKAPGGFQLALVAAVAGVLGFGVAQLAPSDPVETAVIAERWHQDVASYQALYVPETVAALSADPAELNNQFARAETAIGRDLLQAVLSDQADLDLRRAQILGFDGAPLIQIVFEGPGGTPIAFCIMQQGVAADAAVQTAELSGLASAHWVSGGYGYIVIGGTDAEFVAQKAIDLSAVF